MLVFLRPEHKYDSYQDMARLLDSAWPHHSTVKEMDLQAEVDYCWYVCRNDEFKQLAERLFQEKHRCRLWCWDLERPPRPDQGTWEEKWIEVGQLYAEQIIQGIIVSDRWYQQWWKDALYFLNESDETAFRPNIKTLFCPITSMPGLLTLQPLWELGERDWETFVHMSYKWGRREILTRFGQRYKVLENCWGDKRAETLLKCGWGLNVHQDEALMMEPLRFMLYASFGVPILTEECLNTEPYANGLHYLSFAYPTMLEEVHDIVSSQTSIEEARWRAENAYRLITAERPFYGELAKLERSIDKARAEHTPTWPT